MKWFKDHVPFLCHATGVVCLLKTIYLIYVAPESNMIICSVTVVFRGKTVMNHIWKVTQSPCMSAEHTPPPHMFKS